jgi:FKBP-type peptidyl-prolyl cis-trans isomerase (trigger factor)
VKWERSISGGGYDRLIIEAEWNEIAADYDDISAEYAKLDVPGFRPGKAPRSVIENRFRKEIVEDLSRRVAQRLGREAIREAGAEALGPVEADKIECGRDRPFRAELRYRPMPEIVLPDITDLLPPGTPDGDPRDAITRTLLERVRFDIPGEMVEGELAVDGVDAADPSSAEWAAAEERIRLMLILRHIARREGIDVDERDVDDRIAEKAREFQTAELALRAQLERSGGMQRLKDMLLAESTLEYLIEMNSE